MSLVDAMRTVGAIEGWDWSRSRTRMGDLGWSYPDILRGYATDGRRVLDVGTGGGEIFSAVAKRTDVALDVSLDMLAVARTRLPCPVVAADQVAMPFMDESIDVVAARHVGAEPTEVLRMLRPGGVFVTQHPGGSICRSIFEAFGWPSNSEFWARFYSDRGLQFWNVEAQARFFTAADCEILDRRESDVDYEFLDEASLAFWLLNAPLPEDVDPDAHRAILDSLPMKTNWHSELLIVRKL